MALKKKYDYFKAFNSLTEKAIEEADLLINIFENFESADNLFNTMEDVHEIEHSGDDINHEVFKNIARDFITPIDREDLLALSCNLDNILDQIEDCIQRIYIYDVHKVHPQAINFAKIVKRSCETMHECTLALPNYKKNREALSECIVKVNATEEEADLLYMDVIRCLYTKDHSKPIKVMVWSEIFLAMEECCDACEHASDVIRSVILKNS